MRTLLPFGGLALVALVGCQNEGTLHFHQGELALEVDSPTYGAFLRDGPVEVTGHVTPAAATLTIDGEVVTPAEDGTFTASLPFEKAYRIVDVQAHLGEQEERIRVPVFAGQDPTHTFPGGSTFRLTPSGLDHIGRGLGATIDETGWADLLEAQLPAGGFSGMELEPTGLTHEPTVVELRPAPVGVDTEIVLRHVTFLYDLTFELDGTVTTLPVTVGYDRIGMGVLAIPDVDAEGFVTLELTEPGVNMGEPEITIAGIEGPLLDFIGAGIAMLLEPVGDMLLDAVFDEIDVFELGGPYVFDTDLLGTPIEVRLSDLFGDPFGVGAGLGMGLGEPATVGPLAMPTPADDRPEVHTVLGLHEGLLHLVMTGDLLDMLTQDIALPGGMGEIIGAAIRNLPGGAEAPEGDGWCFAMAPTDARVVRLQTGLEPWSVLYLPDVVVDIGVMDGDWCEPWLEASLAFELGLDVTGGTQLSLNPVIAEGAVLSYGATSGWEEEEVIEGLAAFVGMALDMFGGQFSFDLADLFGGMGEGGDDPIFGAFGETELTIVDSRPLLDEEGEHPEGLYELALSLWEP